MGGVNDFHLLARALVSQSNGRLEVWAIERRNNLLEDTRGMESAQARHDPQIALDYYFHRRHRPGAGLLARERTPWMRHWGLATALFDLRAAVRRARHVVGDTGSVLLGGHSLGGMLAQCYAAWDFDGRPGYRDLDGLVLIDGAVGGPAWTETMGLAQYREGHDAIAAGEVFWDQPARGASPHIAVLAQVTAMAVLLPQWRRQPSLVLPYVTQFFHLPSDVALTNAATLGYLIDAETSPIASYRTHVGALDPTPIGEVGGRPLLGWRSHRDCGEPTDLETVARALLQIDGANGMEWYASRRLNAEVDLSSNLDSHDPTTRDLAQAAGLRLCHNAAMPLPVFAVTVGAEREQGGFPSSLPETLPRTTGATLARGEIRGNSSEYSSPSFSDSMRAGARCAWYRRAIASDDFTLVELPHYEHLDPLFAEHDDGGNRCLEALAEWLKKRWTGSKS